MCTSRPDARRRRWCLRLGTARGSQGLGVIELLLALALGSVVAVGALSLWISLERVAAAEVEDTLWSIQSRVGGARLERDLRLASAGGAPFSLAGPLLYASPTQVVIVTRTLGSPNPLLVEWELAEGVLMRRWGDCPASLPLTFPHSMYRDHKTMLEGVLVAGSAFSYELDDGQTRDTLGREELARVRAVTLNLSRVTGRGKDETCASFTARIGR